MIYRTAPFSMTLNDPYRSTVRRSTEKTATEKSATGGKKVHGFLVHREKSPRSKHSQTYRIGKKVHKRRKKGPRINVLCLSFFFMTCFSEMHAQDKRDNISRNREIQTSKCAGFSS